MENENVTVEVSQTDVSELEPLVLARITDVTGSEGNPGDGDIVDNIVWGNEP